jgi:hypothetical protein
MEVKGRQRRGDVGPERENDNTSSEHEGEVKNQEKRKTNSSFKTVEKNICAAL